MKNKEYNSESYDSNVQAKKQWEIDPTYAESGRNLTFDEAEKERKSKQGCISESINFKKYKGKKVLEVGYGRGIELMDFARAGAEVSGIDLSEEHCRYTKQAFEEKNIKADIRAGDITKTKFKEKFDVIYSCGVLHHIKEVDKALKNIYDSLKPNGEFINLVYNKNALFYKVIKFNYIWRFRFFRRSWKDILSDIEHHSNKNDANVWVDTYTKEEWRKKLLEHGFKNIKIEGGSLNKDQLTFFKRLVPNFIFKRINADKYGYLFFTTCKKSVKGKKEKDALGLNDGEKDK